MLWLTVAALCRRMSALHQASLVGNVDIMKILLDNGAQPDLKDVRGKQCSCFSVAISEL